MGCESSFRKMNTTFFNRIIWLSTQSDLDLRYRFALSGKKDVLISVEEVVLNDFQLKKL